MGDAAESCDGKQGWARAGNRFPHRPARYRHWKLSTDGEVATLTMDVDEKGGCSAL